ncbi:MAG: hypothetical protein LAO77_21765 [Acidobacteriia bacterium]|nr:hypothetical protein [Terriglobia bacterium]
MTRTTHTRHHALAGVVPLLFVCALSTTLSAHEKKIVGAFQLTIGWGDEPAMSGFKNSVEVDIADASGAPITDIGGPLTVDVTFGSQRITLPMQPAFGRPGKMRAWLVPTRAGTYSFHFTGTVKGQPIDTTSTCSNKTFGCVIDVAEVEFPAKDPSTGQLAERMARTLPRADAAANVASNARTIGVAALVLAAVALAVVIGAGRRKGRKGD